MPDEVFLDSAFAVALVSPKDELHNEAARIVAQVRAEKRRVVTTRAVLIEIGNGLAKQRYRREAAELLSSIENDPNFIIVSSSDVLYAEALQLFTQRQDKEWGMTDCMSFVVMEQRGIIEALTHDIHFEQAGFRALLREAASS